MKKSDILTHQGLTNNLKIYAKNSKNGHDAKIGSGTVVCYNTIRVGGTLVNSTESVAGSLLPQ